MRHKTIESQRYNLTDFIEYVFYVIQSYKLTYYPYHNSKKNLISTIIIVQHKRDYIGFRNMRKINVYMYFCTKSIDEVGSSIINAASDHIKYKELHCIAFILKCIFIKVITPIFKDIKYCCYKF